ncbi:hypothetical protein E2C01_056885 [Portunus trituberculatus]|uniref:Uncharacterized protein n=1 Tax=Portunus trituberculatus TaxID=210409 RepID=A0A5B7GZF2_PORTR|nr:hypothetical protein [Portunus trituberculatus]
MIKSTVNEYSATRGRPCEDTHNSAGVVEWQQRRVSSRATRPGAPGLLLQVDKKGKWSPSSTKRPHQKPPQRGPPR